MSKKWKNAAPKQGARKETVEIESLAWGGKGLARLKGKVFFVAKSAPLDRAEVKTTREKSDYGEAEIEKILSPSPFRISPVCPEFEKCGGCQILHINYKKQLAEKEKIAGEILRRWSAKAVFHPIVPSPKILEYRHSGDFHVGYEKGKSLFGFYEPGSHGIIPFKNCFLFSKSFNERLSLIKEILASSSFAEKVFKLNLSMDENGKEFVGVVYIKEKSEKVGLSILESLKKADLKGILIAEKNEEEICRAGEISLSYLLAPIPGTLPDSVQFCFDPRSFTQANYEINSVLIRDLLLMINMSNHERVLELFSGIGNFTLPLAQNSKEVVAIESSPAACNDAKANAQSGRYVNVLNLQGSVEDEILKLILKSSKFDAILLDPPRTGAFDIIAHIKAFSPKRVVYISCNLPTLDRDLRRFSDFGFEPGEFRFYDFFPQTYGIETMVLLGENK